MFGDESRTLSIRVLTEYAGMGPGAANRFDRDMKSFERGGATRALTNTGLAIGGIGIAAGVMSAQTAIAFEKSSSHVRAFTQTSQKQLDTWQKQILKVAPQMGIQPIAAMNSMYSIASAGIKNSMAVLVPSMKAASASQTNLSDVTKVVTTVLNTYGLKAREAGKVVDILSKSVNLGAQEWSDMATNMNRVLAIAPKLHVSLQQVGAVYATLSNKGYTSADINQGFGNFLESMSKPSLEGQRTALAMGLNPASLFDLQHRGLAPTVSGIVGASQMAAPSVSDIMARTGIRPRAAYNMALQLQTPGERLAMLLGGSSLSAQIINSLTQGPSFQNNLTGINAYQGSTQNSFNKVQGTAAFQLQKATAQFQALEIELGRGLVPAVTSVLRSLTPTIQAFTTFATKNPGVVTKVLAVATAIGGLSVAARVLGPVTTLGGALVTLGQKAMIGRTISDDAMAFDGLGKKAAIGGTLTKTGGAFGTVESEAKKAIGSKSGKTGLLGFAESIGVLLPVLAAGIGFSVAVMEKTANPKKTAGGFDWQDALLAVGFPLGFLLRSGRGSSSTPSSTVSGGYSYGHATIPGSPSNYQAGAPGGIAVPRSFAGFNAGSVMYGPTDMFKAGIELPSGSWEPAALHVDLGTHLGTVFSMPGGKNQTYTLAGVHNYSNLPKSDSRQALGLVEVWKTPNGGYVLAGHLASTYYSKVGTRVRGGQAVGETGIGDGAQHLHLAIDPEALQYLEQQGLLPGWKAGKMPRATSAARVKTGPAATPSLPSIPVPQQNPYFSNWQMNQLSGHSALFNLASMRTGIPVEVLEAIALQESGAGKASNIIMGAISAPHTWQAQLLGTNSGPTILARLLKQTHGSLPQALAIYSGHSAGYYGDIQQILAELGSSSAPTVSGNYPQPLTRRQRTLQGLRNAIAHENMLGGAMGWAWSGANVAKLPWSAANGIDQKHWLHDQFRQHELTRETKDQQAKIALILGQINEKQYEQIKYWDNFAKDRANQASRRRVTKTRQGALGLGTPDRLTGHCAAEQRNEKHHAGTHKNTGKISATLDDIRRDWHRNQAKPVRHGQRTIGGHHGPSLDTRYMGLSYAPGPGH